MAQPILLLDDDRDLLNMLERVLEHDGHTIVTATNGDKALALCEEERPCLVIADLMLPDIDGEAFLTAFTEHFGEAAPPVAILSATEVATEVAGRGEVVASISKPFDIEEVRSLATKYAGPGNSDPPTPSEG